MALADTAARRLLHGVGGGMAQGIAADAVSMSFGLDGLWQLIVGLLASAAHLLVLPFEALWHLVQSAAGGVSFCFDNVVAALGSAAHAMVVPFEAVWQWLKDAAAVALPVMLAIAAVVCVVALVWFCWPFLCTAAVLVAQALVRVLCFCGHCLYVVAMGLLPSCVSVTMAAPGAAGVLISRAAFVADPRLYFQIFRLAGPVVASAVFCTRTIASAVGASVAALFRL